MANWWAVFAFVGFGVSTCFAVDPPAPEDGTYYRKTRSFHIPFQSDARRPVQEVRLFVQRNGGEWELLSRAEPSQRGFNFSTNADGNYAMSVQTVYRDGTADPAKDQLRPQVRVIIDTVAPRFTVRPFSNPDGTAGVEWDIADEHLDPATIALEYQWQGMLNWEPIDRGANLKARDQRAWTLRPDQKIRIRVKASDLAKNEGHSDGVWTYAGIGGLPAAPATQAVGGSNPFQGNPGPLDPVNSTSIRPAQQSIYFVNSKQIRLDYNVMLGPSDLKKVRMFWQEDKGAWTLAPDRDIKRSGNVIEGTDRTRTEKLALSHRVEKDGPYNFIIIAESLAGASQKDPERGDAPHVQIVVDTTPPDVKLPTPRVSANGSSGGALVDIQWTATDKNLAPAPIKLWYAARAEGPWLTMADHLENTGRYTWTVPPHEGHSFYIKVSARDRAENVGEAVTPEPVIVDLTKPQVNIIEVVPGGR